MLFLVRPGDRQSLLLKIKLTSSRATAVFATLLFLPLWINRKYLLFNELQSTKGRLAGLIKVLI
jgi:hypothetical protein